MPLQCPFNFNNYGVKDARVDLISQSGAAAKFSDGTALFNGKTYLVQNAAEFNALRPGPGDQIILKNGVWKDQGLILAQSNGTHEHPILIRPENPLNVFLTGNSYLRLRGGSNIVIDSVYFFGIDAGAPDNPPVGAEAVDCPISGCNFTVLRLGDSGPTSPGCVDCIVNRVIIDGYNTLEFSNTTNLYMINAISITYVVHPKGKGTTIANSIFRDKRNSNPFITANPSPTYPNDQVTNFYFINNLVTDRPVTVAPGSVSDDSQAEKGEFMQFGSSKNDRSFSVFEGNTFQCNYAKGANIAIKTSDVLFRNNLFRANRNNNFNIRAADRVLVDSNFFNADGAPDMGGVLLGGTSHWIINNRFQNMAFTPQTTGPRRPIDIFMGVYENLALLPPQGGVPFARSKNIVIANNDFSTSNSPGVFLGDSLAYFCNQNDLPAPWSTECGPNKLYDQVLKPDSIYIVNNIFPRGVAPTDYVFFTNRKLDNGVVSNPQLYAGQEIAINNLPINGGLNIPTMAGAYIEAQCEHMPGSEFSSASPASWTTMFASVYTVFQSILSTLLPVSSR